jgi:hypothetical protein
MHSVSQPSLAALPTRQYPKILRQTMLSRCLLLAYSTYQPQRHLQYLGHQASESHYSLSKILYRLMDNFHKKTPSWKPNRVVHHIESTYECFDLQQQLVTSITSFDAQGLVHEPDTFYVVDGTMSVPLVSPCVVLFISSPIRNGTRNL